ncbi:unnamed protein product [Moneuplotes crassus]|uniref:RIIa domain-containing protein n=1 Tax=Euplotes crassus TaxID=5936 RepID=A0AAD1XY97_EUPCR|nr:unnamed protein product [Moneuplotes crassus]
MNFGNLKYYSRYSVPEGFRDILMDLVKEILRDQPEDIPKFCAEYFKALQEGREHDCLDKGARPIPPDRISRAQLDQIRGFNAENQYMDMEAEGEYMDQYGEGEYVQGEYPEGEYAEGEYAEGEYQYAEGEYGPPEGEYQGYEADEGQEEIIENE